MINYIKNYIKKKHTLYYWALCLYKGKDREFRQFCLDYKTNPRIMHYHEYGANNPEKNIYLIKVGNSSVGMFSLIIWTLRYLEFADKFNLTPVVSWVDEVAYFKKEGVGERKNTFEYYFTQPREISIDEAKRSKNVAKSRQEDRAYGAVADSYDFTENELDRLSFIWRKYISLQPVFEMYLNKRVSELLGKSKVIGAHVRGADWRKMRISGHPVAATEEEYIKEIETIVEKKGYDRVFLATDSEGTLEKFQQIFGEKLLYFPEIKRTPKDKSSLVIFDESNDPYRLGAEILLDAFTLAACDGLIAGVSYVSYGVQIIKKSRDEKSNYLKIIDKGLQKKSNNDFKKAADKQRKALKK